MTASPTDTGFHPALPEMVNGHDPMCVNAAGPCCPWMGECACQCTCEDILRIRRDQSARDQAWHDNPCFLCGPHAEYSTYVCDGCQTAMEQRSAMPDTDDTPDTDDQQFGAPV